jgi:hypothetical protein
MTDLELFAVVAACLALCAVLFLAFEALMDRKR